MEARNAIYLGSLKHHIADEKSNELKLVPKFTFDKFLSGSQQEFYERLGNSIITNKEEFYKIKMWQYDVLNKLIYHDTNIFIKSIQVESKKYPNPTEFVLSIEPKINQLTQKDALNAASLKSILESLFFLPAKVLSNFNYELLTKFYIELINENIVFNYLNPSRFNKYLAIVEAKESNILCCEFTIFFSLIKTKSWIENVKNGSSLNKEVAVPNWSAFIENIKEQAIKEAHAIIQKIDDTIIEKDYTKEETIEYVEEEIITYVNRFNNLEAKFYLGLLDDEDKQILEANFCTAILFGSDYSKEKKALHNAYLLYEVIWSLVVSYTELCGGRRLSFGKEGAAHYEVYSLMNSMVFNKETYLQFHEASLSFFRDFEAYRLPLEVHLYNSNETLRSIFSSQLSYLQEILSNAEVESKTLFLQTRLKELKHRELQLKMFYSSKISAEEENKYLTLFKDFLQIEADFINATKNLKLDVVFTERAIQNQKASLTSNLFDTLFTPSKAAYILQMLEDLSITTNGKSILSERKKGAIRGVVDALIEQNITPKLSIDALCNSIADKIGLVLNSKLDVSTTSSDFKKSVLTYLRNNKIPN